MVGITKVDPVKNLDTEQVLPVNKQRVMTRGMLHRILVSKNIPHDVNWGYETLLQIIVRENIPFEPVPPGRLKKKVVEEKPEEPSPLMKDGWPKSVFTLRKWCRERNIPCKNTDKRKDLIEKLRGHKDTA